MNIKSELSQTEKDKAFALVQDIAQNLPLDKDKLRKFQLKNKKDNGNFFSKTELIRIYREKTEQSDDIEFDPKIVRAIRMKPIRTLSGVAVVTVLTMPYPCPGHCLYCPNDYKMPKSYLSEEPGAQRAERNYFDPYLQTFQRVKTLYQMGHNVEKIELIVLGGTWSFYPLSYQIWFITECLRALNDFPDENRLKKLNERYRNEDYKNSIIKNIGLSNNPEKNKKLIDQYLEQESVSDEAMRNNYNEIIRNLFSLKALRVDLEVYQDKAWYELEKVQKKNKDSRCKNVGLVLETRPDSVTKEEVLNLRRLGCTKVQLGIQSLNDEVLTLNQRGHTTKETKNAFKLLRLAGFKIHAHWMPNLYGSNVKKDKKDYDQLFSLPSYKPDELKIYPCSLLKTAPLYEVYQRGDWQPYSRSELLDILVYCLTHTPPYCRLTRIVRDIPSQKIVTGNKKTNFRQIVNQELQKKGLVVRDIRAREIKDEDFDFETISLEDHWYKTTVSNEIFLEFTAITEKVVSSREIGDDKIEQDILQERKLLGFLRLSLPKRKNYVPELKNAALIREVHVYGPVQSLGKTSKDKAQHLGLGKKLIKQAESIAKSRGYQKLAVISAIGTKNYYKQRGFKYGNLYQIKDL